VAVLQSKDLEQQQTLLLTPPAHLSQLGTNEEKKKWVRD
jgi:hypothetical protein